MIRSISDIDGAELPIYDICIVGTGPAGSTLANELVGSGLQVCVLESGHKGRSPFADALRQVDSEGIAIKEYSRERILGGTSTTWAGLSAPLDAIDFEPKGQDPGKWPLSIDELCGYYRQASSRYRFPGLEQFQPGCNSQMRSAGQLTPTWRNLREKIFLAQSEPQNFGKEFSDAYHAPNIDLFLGASVVSLACSDESTATAARVVTESGKRLAIRSRSFVLAAGGIENPRLLLNSTDAVPAGLGNHYDNVGRYLMNHPKGFHGVLQLERPISSLPYFLGYMSGDLAGYAGIRLTEDVQREHDVLNAYVRFVPHYPWSEQRGVEALIYYMKQFRVAFSAWKRMQRGKVVAVRDYAETGDDSDLQNERKTWSDHLGNAGAVAGDLPHVLRYAYYRLQSKKAPTMRSIRLRWFMEMEPNRDNRVVLSSGTDALGVPIAKVVHQPTQRDKKTIAVLAETLDRELRDQGLGVIQPRITADTNPWPADLDASHHLGTTRMGEDPKTSCVDAHCRLHAVDNVYLAGGSVFTTSGNANPTYTIVALAIRLAEHLKYKAASP